MNIKSLMISLFVIALILGGISFNLINSAQMKEEQDKKKEIEDTFKLSYSKALLHKDKKQYSLAQILQKNKGIYNSVTKKHIKKLVGKKINIESSGIVTYNKREFSADVPLDYPVPLENEVSILFGVSFDYAGVDCVDSSGEKIYSNFLSLKDIIYTGNKDREVICRGGIPLESDIRLIYVFNNEEVAKDIWLDYFQGIGNLIEVHSAALSGKNGIAF